VSQNQYEPLLTRLGGPSDVQLVRFVEPQTVYETLGSPENISWNGPEARWLAPFKAGVTGGTSGVLTRKNWMTYPLGEQNAMPFVPQRTNALGPPYTVGISRLPTICRFVAFQA